MKHFHIVIVRIDLNAMDFFIGTKGFNIAENELGQTKPSTVQTHGQAIAHDLWLDTMPLPL